MAQSSDVLIIGGGVVGASLALGMATTGARVRLIDGADADLRAARANFGLIWVQSKGHDMPAYARWTRQSADLWPTFAEGLAATTGHDVRLRQPGGLSYCLGEAALDAKREALSRLHNQREPWSAEIEVLDRPRLEALLPGVRLGPGVSGASFCAQDGEADPLMLLRALHVGMALAAVTVEAGAPVRTISRSGGVFHVMTDRETYAAPRLILAAGLGSVGLAEQVGLAAPLRPQRGQILVTERLAPFLPFAGDTIRQTADGTVMIGATHEDVGFDTGTTADAAAGLAQHARDVFPDLAATRLVRTWAGLRVLTPDGAPLYQESQTHPGAALVTCHSGVTLAAVHARVLAPALLAGQLDPRFAPFGTERFSSPGVSQAA